MPDLGRLEREGGLPLVKNYRGGVMLFRWESELPVALVEFLMAVLSGCLLVHLAGPARGMRPSWAAGPASA